jgi:hypothetical protein
MDVLGTVMDAREDIQYAENEEEMFEIKKANEERIAGTMKELSAAFGSGDFGMARDLVVRLKYWTRIEEAVKEKM